MDPITAVRDDSSSAFAEEFVRLSRRDTHHVQSGRPSANELSSVPPLQHAFLRTERVMGIAFRLNPSYSLHTLRRHCSMARAHYDAAKR